MAEETLTKWRVIVPADNWRNPIHVDHEEIGVLIETAKRLGLIHTVEAESQKLYLKMPCATAEPKVIQPDGGNRIDFPSGMSLPIVEWTVMGDKYRPADLSRAAPLVRWAKFENLKVSEHFSLWEFICHDRVTYGYVRLDPKLVDLLEKIRAEAGGKPISVTSGYRPPAYQAIVNPKVTNSEHMNGTAADITCRALGYAEFYALCDRLNPNGGVGRYPAHAFVHVDVRGSRARWG